jgi:glycosyltransferase involved in cell wall biosynthesis
MTPRRILFLDHATILGGGQLSLAEHLRALDRTRFEPVVACSPDASEVAALFRGLGIEVHLLPFPRLRRLHPAVIPRLLISALAIRRLVRRLNVVLVATSTSRTAYLASIGLLGTGTPLIWWVRDFLFGRLAFRLLSRRATSVICVSEALRRFYGGASDERFSVIVVGSTLYHTLKSISDDEVEATRQRWNLAKNDVVVGFMGRLVEEKGVEDVIQAVAELHRTNPRVKLLVVGTGRDQLDSVEDRARTRVAANGWSFIQFAGFQDNEALFYRLFDVVVLASREHEGYGMSAVQAMMAGTPVVATAVGGTPELVRDRVTGLLVPPAAPDRIADAVRELIHDPALRQRVRAAALTEVMANNREEVTTERAEQLYESLLGDRRAVQVSEVSVAT